MRELLAYEEDKKVHGEEEQTKREQKERDAKALTAFNRDPSTKSPSPTPSPAANPGVSSYDVDVQEQFATADEKFDRRKRTRDMARARAVVMGEDVTNFDELYTPSFDEDDEGSILLGHGDFPR